MHVTESDNKKNEKLLEFHIELDAVWWVEKFKPYKLKNFQFWPANFIRY